MIIRNTLANDNFNNGFIAIGTSRSVAMALDTTSASLNGNCGVYAGSLSTVTLSNVQVSGNLNGLCIGGGQIASFGNNHVTGNGTNGAPNATLPNL